MGRCKFLILLTFAIIVPSSAFADTTYSFQTVINPADPSFTALNGINNSNTIAGYTGDGTIVPNLGFNLTLPNSFTPENFPGGVQTQVIGINASGNTAGFYVDSAGNTNGFVKIGSVFATVDNPLGPGFTQLLGLNNSGVAVGYYMDASSVQHAFTVIGTTFTGLDPSLPSNIGAQATGIDSAGDLTGFYLDAAGNSHGFVIKGGLLSLVNVPGAVSTEVLGINNNGDVVGFYLDSSLQSHGFVFDMLTNTFQIVDDPSSAGTSVINGINDLGDLVGFYTDGAGNTDGFVATPNVSTPEPSSALLLGSGLLAFLRFRRRTS